MPRFAIGKIEKRILLSTRDPRLKGFDDSVCAHRLLELTLLRGGGASGAAAARGPISGADEIYDR